VLKKLNAFGAEVGYFNFLYSALPQLAAAQPVRLKTLRQKLS
jgi:hypothetical protein